MNTIKRELIPLSTFIVNPIISLIFCIFRFIKYREFYPITLSISISLIYCYLPILYDSVMNFFITYDISFGYERNMRSYNLIQYYIMNFGFSYISTLFLSSFVILLIYFNYFRDKINLNSKTNVLFVFLFLFMFLNYREIMDLNRYYLSLSLFFYFLIKYPHISIRKNFLKKISLIMMLIISISLHSSVFIYLIFLFLTLIFKKINFYIFYIPVCCALSFFSSDLLLAFSKLLFLTQIDILVDIGVKIFEYSNSSLYGSGGVLNNTLGFKLYKFLICIFLIIVFYNFIFYKKKDKITYLEYFSLIIVGIPFIFIQQITFFERYSIGALLFSLVLIDFKSYKFSWFKAIILLIIAIRFMLSIYLYRDIYTNKYNYVISNNVEKNHIVTNLYLPTPFLLNFSNFGFSNEFLLSYGKRDYLYEVFY